MNKPRMRRAMAAVAALSAAPDGFSVADLTAKVRAMTGSTDNEYTARQAAYDLRLAQAPGQGPGPQPLDDHADSTCRRRRPAPSPP